MTRFICRNKTCQQARGTKWAASHFQRIWTKALAVQLRILTAKRLGFTLKARDKSTGKSEDVARDARSSVKASKDSYIKSNHQAKEEALQRNGPGDESPVTGQAPSTGEGGPGTSDQHGRGEGFESGSSGSALYDSATA
jgi:hypothetical protein